MRIFGSFRNAVYVVVSVVLSFFLNAHSVDAQSDEWKNYVIEELNLSLDAPLDTELISPSRYDGLTEVKIWEITNGYNFDLSISAEEIADHSDLSLYVHATNHRYEVLNLQPEKGYVKLIEDVSPIKLDNNLTAYTLLYSIVDTQTQEAISVIRVFHIYHDGLLYIFNLHGLADTFDSQTMPMFIDSQKSLRFLK